MVTDLAEKSAQLSSVVDRLNDLLATSLLAVVSSPDKDAEEVRKEPKSVKLDVDQPVAHFPWSKPEAGRWKPRRARDTAYVVDKLLDNSMVQLSV